MAWRRRLAGGAVAVALLALGTPPGEAQARPDVPDLSGTFAELRVLTEVQPVPLVGDVTIAQKFLSLHKIARDGRVVTSKGVMCGLRFEASHRRLKPSVSAGFLKALGVLEGESRLVWRGSQQRWELKSPRRSDVVGADLKKPSSDPLPERAKDGRVTDPDKDGRPGVTVSVSGLANGDLYLVQRIHTALRGIVRSADAVDGIVTWNRDQSVLGASSFILRSPPQGVPHPDKSRHFFKLRRVPEGTTCEELKRLAPTLFKAPETELAK